MWSQRVYVDHLRNVSLFEGFSRKDLETIASVGQHVTVKADTVLLKEDTDGYDAYVLLSGTVKVTRRGRAVGTVQPGAILGELSLLDQGTRTATATCLTDCDVLVLSRRTFLATIDRVPALQHKLLTTLASKIRDLDRRAM